jgi:hypothetical protein
MTGQMTGQMTGEPRPGYVGYQQCGGFVPAATRASCAAC